jgi:hypothetical protein
MHVLDIGFEDKQIRRAFAVHLQAVFVVPLDYAFENFAIAQNDRHWRLGLHLFQVIEIFCVGLFRRRGPFGAAPGLRPLAFDFGLGFVE